MHARIPIAVTALLLLAGCNESTKKPNVGSNVPSSNVPSSSGAAADRAATNMPVTNPDTVKNDDATNTGKNARDRDGNAPTADNQSESRGDLETTAEIRRAITKDSSLSVNAHNIKIVTENGSVFLRGPVDSEEEKARVVAEARRVAGDAKVVDELEVNESANRKSDQP